MRWSRNVRMLMMSTMMTTTTMHGDVEFTIMSGIAVVSLTCLAVNIVFSLYLKNDQ